MLTRAVTRLRTLLAAFGDWCNPDRVGPASWANDTDQEDHPCR